MVYPLGLACVLILLAIFLQRQANTQRAVLILALALLWVGGNRWTAAVLTRSLEWRYTAPDPIPQVEVLVVLGGGTSPAEPPRPIVEVNGAGDRVIYAAWLYREGKAKSILVSGGILNWDQGVTSPAQDMATLLEWMGVPPEAILVQGKSENTYDDARFSAQILSEKGVNQILLVTSASHMPRSVKLFEAQGLQVIPLPTDYNLTYQDWDQMVHTDARSFVLGLFPSAGNLNLTSLILKEDFGIFVYGLRGWLG